MFSAFLGLFPPFRGGGGWARWVMVSDSLGIRSVYRWFMVGFLTHVPRVKVFVFNDFWVISGIWGILGPRGVRGSWVAGSDGAAGIEKGHVRWLRTCPYSFIIAGCQGILRWVFL